MDFGERLEILLKNKGITQKSLAEQLSIRRPLISEWKKNGSYPYADVAVRMANVLGTTVEYLIAGKDPKGLSEDSLKIALAAEQLSPEGRKVALTQVEALQAHFPFAASVSIKTGSY
jgi:transcriptional regulator with XRE-family HTH domain